MTLDEADRIIAELNICFPNKNLLVEEVKRWETNLEPYNFEDARLAVKTIEDNLKFWPTWADFKEAISPHVRARNALESRESSREHFVLSEEDYAKSKAVLAQLKNRFTGK